MHLSLWPESSLASDAAAGSILQRSLWQRFPHMPSDRLEKPRLMFFMAAKDSRIRSVALPATACALAAAVLAPNLCTPQIAERHRTPNRRPASHASSRPGVQRVWPDRATCRSQLHSSKLCTVIVVSAGAQHATSATLCRWDGPMVCVC